VMYQQCFTQPDNMLSYRRHITASQSTETFHPIKHTGTASKPQRRQHIHNIAANKIITKMCHLIQEPCTRTNTSTTSNTSGDPEHPDTS